MGSKNMGSVLRAFVRSRYPEGKRDLYAAFLSRALSICAPGGAVAFVTLESWCFIKAFASLRCRIVNEATLDSIAFLGRHAFDDADPPGLPTMSVIRRQAAPEGHRIWTVRLTTPRDAVDQAEIVRRSAEKANNNVYRVRQADLHKIPNHGFFTWLPEEVLETLTKSIKLGQVAECLAGLQTGDSSRVIRFTWEARSE